MKKAEAAGNDNCPVKIKLVAPPLYVLTTQTLDKVDIILVLNICEQFVIAEPFEVLSALRPISHQICDYNFALNIDMHYLQAAYFVC
jgi:hypothetical protein